MHRVALIGLAVFSAHGVAFAQGPGLPQAQRAEGTVSALGETSLTLAKADGTSETIALLPERSVTIVEPIAVDQIQPGSYVATANTSQADGSGTSIELRVYAPGTPRINVNRAMDESGATMMTNGTVATAISAEGGRVLSVDYGEGKRKITVPKTLGVVFNSPGTPAQVQVGVKLAIVTFPAAGGRPARQSITIAKKDLPGQ